MLTDPWRCPDARPRLGREDPKHMLADRVPQVDPHQGQFSGCCVAVWGGKVLVMV